MAFLALAGRQESGVESVAEAIIVVEGDKTFLPPASRIRCERG